MKRFAWTMVAAAVTATLFYKASKTHAFEKALKAITPHPHESHDAWMKRLCKMTAKLVPAISA